MLQQNDGGLLGIKYRSHAGYDKVRCMQICVYRVIVFRCVFVRRLTCFALAGEGLAGAGGVGGDDLNAVLRVTQQIEDQQGVHIIPYKCL